MLSEVDNKIVQCEKEIAELGKILKELQEEKKDLERRVVKVGDVFMYTNNMPRIVIATQSGLICVAETGIYTSLGDLDKYIKVHEYKFVGNVFEGTATWIWRR